MMKTFSRFSKTLLWDKASFKFAIGVWLGLSFSIAVILSTIGIMDGFITTMKSGPKVPMVIFTFILEADSSVRKLFVQKWREKV